MLRLQKKSGLIIGYCNQLILNTVPKLKQISNVILSFCVSKSIFNDLNASLIGL